MADESVDTPIVNIRCDATGKVTEAAIDRWPEPSEWKIDFDKAQHWTAGRPARGRLSFPVAVALVGSPKWATGGADLSFEPPVPGVVSTSEPHVASDAEHAHRLQSLTASLNAAITDAYRAGLNVQGGSESIYGAGVREAWPIVTVKVSRPL